MPGGGHASTSQLLELTLISARDLARVSKSMKCFAVAWVSPAQKLKTRPDNTGHTDPVWNEKFVFRVNRDFLSDESSAVTVEIYATTRRDVGLIGTVNVPVVNLFSRSTPKTRPSKMRFFTLQIKRPSGRAHGVLEVGVALLDGARRSMPLSDLSSDLVDDRNNYNNKKFRTPKVVHKIMLRRSKSEQSVSECYLLKAESEVSSSAAPMSESALNYGSLCSDIGPSPSVVAAAIAKGLYRAPKKIVTVEEETAESSILDDWVEDDESVEGLKTKIERWRSEIHPIYQKAMIDNNAKGRSTYRKNELAVQAPPKTPGPAPSSKHRRGKSGLFSCFGTAYGCEFSITCGGGNGGRKKKSDGAGEGDGEAPVSLPDRHYDDHYV